MIQKLFFAIDRIDSRLKCEFFPAGILAGKISSLPALSGKSR
jgi:hypothetical protein